MPALNSLALEKRSVPMHCSDSFSERGPSHTRIRESQTRTRESQIHSYPLLPCPDQTCGRCTCNILLKEIRRTWKHGTSTWTRISSSCVIIDQLHISLLNLISRLRYFLRFSQPSSSRVPKAYSLIAPTSYCVPFSWRFGQVAMVVKDPSLLPLNWPRRPFASTSTGSAAS